MSAKSWIIPYLGTATGLGFVIISFLSGVDVNPSHVQLLDYLLYLTLGSGSIGAANKGFKMYQEFKNKPS